MVRKAKLCGVECPVCGSTETYFIDKKDGSVFCDECDENFFVDQDENGEYFAELYMDEDKPSCCVVCGGPYPLCSDGCSLID